MGQFFEGMQFRSLIMDDGAEVRLGELGVESIRSILTLEGSAFYQVMARNGKDEVNEIHIPERDVEVAVVLPGEMRG